MRMAGLSTGGLGNPTRGTLSGCCRRWRYITGSGPSPFTWDDVSYRLAELLELPHVEVRVTGTPTYYEFDLGKAQRDLGFSPSCDIVKMMVDALNYGRGEDIGVLPHG